jgi:hypothetical protein
LRPATEYVFRFQAVNEAGWGEQMEITATTQSVNPPEARLTDGATSLCSPAWALFLVILTVLLDGGRHF